jgi:hypothetical protein
MGRDQGALRVDGTTLIERAAAKLAGIGFEVVLADRGASGGWEPRRHELSRGLECSLEPKWRNW